MTAKGVLQEIDLSQKAIKIFEYSPLGSELKKQTNTTKKLYQKLEKTFEPNKKEENKTKNKKRCANSNLVYSKDFAFFKYDKTKEFAAKRPFDSKQNDLRKFKDILELFYHDTEEIKPNNEEQKKELKERKAVFVTASELYNKLLNIYVTQYYKLRRKG